MFKNTQHYRFKREDFNHFYLLNILIYTSEETSTCIIKCEFCARAVILDPISACVILMCREKQSQTPWRSRKHMPKSVGFEKWLSYKNCTLIVGE